MDCCDRGVYGIILLDKDNVIEFYRGRSYASVEVRTHRRNPTSQSFKKPVEMFPGLLSLA